MLSLTIIITALSALTVPASTEPEDEESRGRQLSLLSIFSFPNSECVSGLEGTKGECYTASECYARGGTSQSTCASGIGVCCYVVQESCQTENEVIYNNTYIRSVNIDPSHPPSASALGTWDTPGASAQAGPALTRSNPAMTTSVSSGWTSRGWTWRSPTTSTESARLTASPSQR